MEARLLYPTQTGEHRVFGIGMGNPVPRLSTKRGRENPFFASTG